MARYYVNKNTPSTGKHKVHKNGCHRMPEPQNRIYLGYFSDTKKAVKKARRYFGNVAGCYYCASKVHKR